MLSIGYAVKYMTRLLKYMAELKPYVLGSRDSLASLAAYNLARRLPYGELLTWMFP